MVDIDKRPIIDASPPAKALGEQVLKAAFDQLGIQPPNHYTKLGDSIVAHALEQMEERGEE